MSNQLQTTVKSELGIDDIVNVYVSRHENALMQRATDLRVKAQAINKRKQALLDKVKSDAATKAIAAFSAMTTDNVKFTVDGSDVEIRDTVAFIHVEQVTALPQGFKYCTHHWGHRNELSDEVKAEFHAQIDVDQATLDEARELEAEGDQVKAELLEVNDGLASIERKTRQIKAVISEKKLADAGMTELVDMPEVNAILQLN